MKFQKKQARPKILLINSDRHTQKSLYEMLSLSGYDIQAAESVEESIGILEKTFINVILLDIAESENIDSITALKERSKNSEIIVIAAYGDLNFAVNSIKLGAFECLTMPISDKKIISTIKKAVSNTPAEPEKKTLITKLCQKEKTFHGLVGKNEKMLELYSVIGRISEAKTTVLIHGESGTGKRLVAHAIHKGDHRRKNKPFVELSCGALPREIIESELFGHTKGAFTGAINDRRGRFELAHGGTILLDDIDSLPPDLQVKLLRVIQHKEFERVGDQKTIKVDVRIITTTNQDIKKAVSEKRFREDLYYRINVISLWVPPLRERKEDLPVLVEHFISYYSNENHKKIKGISKDAVEALANYNWPGNIRELENIIERAIILDTDNMIKKDDLPEPIINTTVLVNGGPEANFLGNSFTTKLKESLKEPEKLHILRILKEVGFNKKKAALKLGVNRTTLYNKLKKYSISSDIEYIK